MPVGVGGGYLFTENFCMSVETETFINTCARDEYHVVYASFLGGLKHIECSTDVEIPEIPGVLLFSEFVDAVPGSNMNDYVDVVESSLRLFAR